MSRVKGGMRLAPLGSTGLESQAASRLVIHGSSTVSRVKGGMRLAPLSPSGPEDQLNIIYDPYCKKLNALSISTPIGIDFRNYYAIELVYHYINLPRTS